MAGRAGNERRVRWLGGSVRLAPPHGGVWAGVECVAARWVCEGVCLQRLSVREMEKEEAVGVGPGLAVG